MMNEIWKSINDYEGLYEASNLGRIRSLPRNTTKGKILKLRLKGHYLQVVLTKDGKQTDYTVSRIIWESFNGPIPEGMQVNHINENTLDNSLENLNLMTPKENSNWGTRTERIIKLKKKTVQQFSLDGVLVKEWDSVKDAANYYNASPGNIASVCRGDTYRKSAAGFVWKYKERAA